MIGDSGVLILVAAGIVGWYADLWALRTPGEAGIE